MGFDSRTAGFKVHSLKHSFIHLQSSFPSDRGKGARFVLYSYLFLVSVDSEDDTTLT